MSLRPYAEAHGIRTLLARAAFAQQEYSIEVHLDDDGLLPGSKVKCMGEVPRISLARYSSMLIRPFPRLSTLPALLAGG